MPSKYNEAISKIIIDEEKKEEIIKKLKENNATSKRVTLLELRFVEEWHMLEFQEN